MRVVRLDLASLSSVREAAGEISSSCPRLDLLINNAGVMRPPYGRSADGFELTLATNHLGHFALTGLVLDRLLDTCGSRIVTVSSVGAPGRRRWRFDDLQFEGGYRADDAYAQSKLANLLFTYELAARLRAAGRRTIALAAHPGVARTRAVPVGSAADPGAAQPGPAPAGFWGVHDARLGALPVLRAAADPSARAGEYYGPGRWRRVHRLPGPGRVERQLARCRLPGGGCGRSPRG